MSGPPFGRTESRKDADGVRLSLWEFEKVYNSRAGDHGYSPSYFCLYIIIGYTLVSSFTSWCQVRRSNDCDNYSMLETSSIARLLNDLVLDGRGNSVGVDCLLLCSTLCKFYNYAGVWNFY